MLAGALVAACGAACPAVLAQVETQAPPELAPRILIDRALAQRPVRLLSISPDSIEVLDASGHSQTIARKQVLALVPPLTELDQPVVEERTVLAKPDAEKVRPYGRLDLVDGQQLLGILASPSTPQEAPDAAPKPKAKDDSFSWNSKLFGPVTLPLESASTIILAPEKVDVVATGKEDTVVLSNGDRVEGFVAAIGAAVRVEKNGKASDLPVSRVAGVRLSNPAKSPAGAWVWLYDGTAAAVSTLAADSSGHASIVSNIPGAAAQAYASIDSNDLRAVCFDMSVVRPLAACASATTPSPTRRWTPPLKVSDEHGAPLGLPDVELPGPMTVEWTLPQGATRLGTTIELPPSSRVWGDCEVTIESVAGGKASPLAKERMNGEHASAELNVALAGASKVRVTLSPGASGPIQDRIVLRRPMVLVK